jgi:fumarate hydratase subunit alpha
MDESYIVDGLVRLIQKAETELPLDVIFALKKAYEQEEGIARIQLENILKNIEIAKKTKRPLCQDTGVQTFFIEVGKDFPYIGKLKDLLLTSVKKATFEIPLRPNTFDPFTKRNHKDNIGEYIPAITWDFIDEDYVIITAIPKGGGSENMSKLVMLKPGEGMEGVESFILREIQNAGGNPCPPTVVGIGIGGGADLAMKLGKKALLRPVGIRHNDPNVAKVEKNLIKKINQTGIGPMGLGGKTTVLDVHIEKAPRHPASLPVGMVVQCWADRRATMILKKDGRYEMVE